MTYAHDLYAGSTVLVTGGTSGLGAATAEAFAALGADVIAAGLNSDAMPTAPGVRGVELDVTDQDAVLALFAALQRLDVLVNCAGVIRRDDEFDTAVFEAVLDVNLTGTMRTSTAALPLLRETSGCIINTASMHSFVSGPRVPAYTASKGGVAQLTKALANSFAGDGVRVNAVAPGWISTPLTSEVESSEAGAAIRSRTPMGRWGRPDEVADAALFLASPAARFITGAILAVDGGYLVR